MPYKNIQVNPAQYKTAFTNKQSQFYIGYSSVNSDSLGSTVLYDFDLIKQDLLNQFNTKQGERLMNPLFGTIIWSLLYEPFTDDVKQAIADDVTRVCNYDPRIIPIQIDINEQEYGLMLEITLQYKGTDQSSNLKLSFDKEIGLVSQ